MIQILLLLLLLPTIVWGQTTNSRTQDGDGNKIVSTTGTPAVGDRGLTTKDAILANRFPTAFASADNIAAQTATFIHGGLMAWDIGGSNWDKVLLTAGALHVNVQNASLAVTGTFWQATQPISAASLPLPTGAALDTSVDGLEGLLSTSNTNTANTSSGVGATGDVAATVGSTGSLSAKLRLITSQLDALQTELNQKTEPGNTQTISGTVTANAGTNLNTSALMLDATVTGRWPSAAALADATANPTLTGIATYNMCINASLSWDRCRGTTIDTDDNSVAFSQSSSLVLNMNYVSDGSAWVRWRTYLESTASAGGEQLVLVGTIRQDTPASTTTTDGHFQNLKTDSIGRLWTHVAVIDAFPDNEPFNVAQLGGTTVVNGGLAGSQSVGGTAASNAAITQNPLLIAGQALSTQPVAATTGNQRQIVVSLDGAQYVRIGGPITWSCGVTAIGTTLTECQAVPGAGLSLYLTDVVTQSNTATAGLFTLRFGTGTNCGTGTGNLFFNSASALMASPANTVAVNHFHLTTPIKVTANNAVCVLGVATNTTNAQLTGFTAP
jgi:hypothetical protein